MDGRTMVICILLHADDDELLERARRHRQLSPELKRVWTCPIPPNGNSPEFATHKNFLATHLLRLL